MAHGDVGHLELPADDPGRARRFYEGVFGWQFQEVPDFPDYYLFNSPSGQVQSGGAIGKRGATAGERLRQYITVDSIEAALPKVQELGGSIVEGKQDVPGQGFYAVITDSEGNELGVWENLPGS